jgi:hypothetical protein
MQRAARPRKQSVCSTRGKQNSTPRSAREAKQRMQRARWGKNAEQNSAMQRALEKKQPCSLGRNSYVLLYVQKKSVARKFSNTRDSVAIGNAYNTK